MWCGIICAMTEAEIDDTNPSQVDSEPGEVHDNQTTSIEETTPTPVTSQTEEPESGFEDTIAPPIQELHVDDPQGGGKQRPVRKWRSRLLISLLGVLALGLIGFISAYAGFRSGISLREDAESTQVSQVVQEQYELGVQEMGEGNYFRARQRFEYVIQLDPDYPGATEKLAEVLLELNTTATPTLVPTPTLAPTPDLRDIQELFDQGQSYIANGDWTNAIDTLLVLRKNDPNFKPVEVDGMLFIALRNRGADKISLQADLEGGIYDLTLASRFGPLDSEAQSFLNWTSMYITGASFWGIDWEQAVNYFSQVAPQMPYLTDGSGWTASERLRTALFEYGNSLARSGSMCSAVAQYQGSLSIAYDGQVEAALNEAAKACQGPGAPRQPQETQPPGG